MVAVGFGKDAVTKCLSNNETLTQSIYKGLSGVVTPNMQRLGRTVQSRRVYLKSSLVSLKAQGPLKT